MLPFKKCPVCNGELVQKEVEKLLKGGSHIASVKVKADVCTGCGERLYPQEAVRLFENIRKKLRLEQLNSFQPVGQFFEVGDMLEENVF